MYGLIYMFAVYTLPLTVYKEVLATTWSYKYCNLKNAYNNYLPLSRWFRPLLGRGPLWFDLDGTRSHKQPLTLRILGGRLQEFRQYFSSSFPIAD